ncbi:MAG: signal recognition particle-docking protein FtsY [Opitutales bacterium]|nr:signal recognition particle-docking protein FtsY [Opitutales bacterium]
MKSFFDRIKEGLRRTTPTFYKAFGAVGGLFSGKALSQDDIDSLEEALYGADIGVETATEILDRIREAYRREKELRGQEAAKIGAEVLRRVLAGAEGRLENFTSKPEVIALIGVNGSGKTTTTAKLGHMFMQDGKSVLVGACDTFRAAANEQLKSWCDRLGLELVASQTGADAAAVAFDAYEAAAKRGKDVLILDTAGRLHTKHNLLGELDKIRRVLQKRDVNAPQHRWLVLDGSIGSNSIEQARVFHKQFDLTGLVITKLDGTSRGGALVGIYREMRLPIYYVGLGEGPEDLQPFSVDGYVNAMFGLGQ